MWRPEATSQPNASSEVCFAASWAQAGEAQMGSRWPTAVSLMKNYAVVQQAITPSPCSGPKSWRPFLRCAASLATAACRASAGGAEALTCFKHNSCSFILSIALYLTYRDVGKCTRGRYIGIVATSMLLQAARVFRCSGKVIGQASLTGIHERSVPGVLN
jgi:hypothetical protein